jgi:hypothetical protein
MSSRGFEPGGYEWRAQPGFKDIPWGRARHLWEYLVWRARNRFFDLELTDAMIADALGRSRRYVQLALAELQRLGWITREFVFKVSRWGNTVYRRVIKILRRPAGSEPKSKSTIDLDPKKLDTHRANLSDKLSHKIADSSSSEELKALEQQRAVVGECVEAHPSTGQGEEDAPAEAPDPAQDALALAALMAQVAAAAAPKGPQTPPETPAAVPASESPVAALMRKHEVMAASGDPIAIAELAALRRAVPVTAPTVPPEPVSHDPAPAGPPPAPSVSPLSLGRSLISWFFPRRE